MSLFGENESNIIFLILSTSNKIIANKKFWKLILNFFLTNKGCLENSDIILRCDKKMITDEKKLVHLFNDHYISTAERF